MRKTFTLAVLALAVPVATGLAAKPAQPTLTIAVAPTSVSFGKPVTVTGAISSKAAGETVTLEALTFPYTGRYAKAGTATTGPDGTYSVAVVPTMSTKYKVTAKKTSDSPEVTVPVRWSVGLRVGDRTPRRGQSVRFFGTVKPANVGAAVLVQRRTATGWRTVRQTTLAASTATSSVYTLKLKIRRTGRYRTEIPANGALQVGHSVSRRLVVH